MKTKTFIIFIFLLFIYSFSITQDSLEVIMTFEMPEAVTFRPHYGGNFNNDNYDDLLYTYYNSSTHETKLQFYFGNPNPEPIPDLEYEIVSYMAGQPSWSGDLNNDGYKDIVLSITYDVLYPGDIYVFLGADSINIDPDEPDIIFYGWYYAPDPIGLFFCGSNYDVDFNGDGYADILAGGIGPDWFFNGQVDLFFGGEEIDTIPDFHIQGAILDQFGLFKTVGDINGDGYCDLIASRSIEFDGPLKYEIYLGGPDMDTIMDYEIDKLYYISLGRPSSNGDINGDGFDDLIIPLYLDDNLEYIDVYFGCIDDSLTCHTQIQCNAYISNIFYCDINNDGYSDIVVTIRTENKVYIYYGSENFDTEPDIILEGNNPNGWFGEYGCNLGDFNGNGKNEIIINNGQPFNISTVYTLSGGSGVDNNTCKVNDNSIISNYPNPFINKTSISFFLKGSSHIELDIFNIKGQRVKTLFSELVNYAERMSKLMKGSKYEIVWDGTDNNGHCLGSGIYFIKLRTEKCVNVKKVVKIMR